MAKTTLYEKRLRELRNSVVSGIVFSLLLTLLLIIVVANGFFLIKIEVNKTSMLPTVLDGDIVYADKYRKPNYGDIVIISGEESSWIIKRVIAMEGDTVMIKGGSVYLKKSGEDDFFELQEKYLNKSVKTPCRIGADYNESATFNVGEKEIFYLGDNRTVSVDSRSDFGNCTESQIVGVVTEWSIKVKGVSTAINKFLSGIFGGQKSN